MTSQDSRPLDSLRRHNLWRAAGGVLTLGLGLSAAIGEMLLGLDFGSEGYGWGAGLTWALMSCLGVYLLLIAPRADARRIAQLEHAKLASVSFILHMPRGGDSREFQVRISGDTCEEAVRSNWKAKVSCLFNESFLADRIGTQRGKAWFESVTSEPLAIEIDGTVFLLTNAVPDQ